MSNWENDKPTDKQIIAIKNMQKALNEPEFVPDTRGECSTLISNLKFRLGIPNQSRNGGYGNNTPTNNHSSFTKESITKIISWIEVIDEFKSTNEARTSDAAFLFLMNNFDVSRKKEPIDNTIHTRPATKEESFEAITDTDSPF